MVRFFLQWVWLWPFGLYASDKIKNLDYIAPPHTLKGRLVTDVRLYLEASEALSDHKKWVRALAQADSTLGPLILEEWIAELKNSRNDKEVVEFILNSTQSGNLSPFFRKKGLHTASKLQAYLARRGFINSYEMGKKIPAPWRDPSLNKAAHMWCDSKGFARSTWDTWQRDLKADQRRYWELMKERCSSIESFETKLRSFATSSSLSKDLKIVALRQLAVTQRQLGQRTHVWRTYDLLLAAWKLWKPQTSHQLNSRIDDHLWAARYHAFVGHYQKSEAIVLKAQKLTSAAKGKMGNRKHSRKLRELEAEALHILSFRIAVAKREYRHGAQLIGKNWNSIPKNWKQRFQWYEGLLYYLDGNYKRALDSWVSLSRNVRGTFRPKVLFWVSRLFHMQNQKQESEKYRQMLTSESPFSFYNVVALKQAKMHSEELPNPVVPMRLNGEQDKVLEEHGWVGPLWQKSEILMQAGLFKVAKPVIKEVDRRIRKRFGVGKYLDQYIRLSRLHYRSGNFRQAIALSADLSGVRKKFWKTWPDQIAVFFPRPYFHRWEQSNVDAQSVPTSVLLAIARQESAFDAKAVSPANAHGLMQLTIPTARDLIKVEDPDHILAEKLLNPEMNIQVGALYLNNLRKRYQSWPYVFAAYNAGEVALDAWLKHRTHRDILTWLELIPFGETRKYVMAVWRNQEVYQNYLPKLSSDQDHSKEKSKGRRARLERPLRDRKFG